jgi:two-component system nitrate/nitrite response regulator NarL
MAGREVLIVEDDPRFSLLIEGMLRSAGFTVRCASGGIAALAFAAEHGPEVAVVDLGLPDCEGTELVRQLARSDTRVLVLTGPRTAAEVIGAIRAGAAGFLFKEDLGRRLVPAIDDILEGGAPLSAAATKALMAEVRGESGTRRTSPQQDASERLTAREREVLAALARGLTYDQVGMVLDVSGNTVRTHIRKLYQKLGAASRTEAVLAAMERGVLRPSSGIGPDSGRPPAF